MAPETPTRRLKFLRNLWRAIVVAGLILLPSSSIELYAGPGRPPPYVAAADVPPSCSAPVDRDWIDKVEHIRWVAYSSPNPNPGPGFFQPSTEAITGDLLTLKRAGFTGLVTYGSAGVMGRDFPAIAQSLGFDGLILGIWNPDSEDEMNNARRAASLPIVLGYGIGNEGLYGSRDRYSLAALCGAIADLRLATGRPATTSEEIDDYESHPELLAVGDWIFPIAHPYWHSTKYAEAALAWEQDEYRALAARTDRFVLFKEVGLPTSGAYGLSEANNDLFYRGLAASEVRFVYFEGFDQPSKTGSSVEPNWGIFRSNHRPKLLGWNLMGYRPFSSTGANDGWVLECAPESGTGCQTDTSEPTLIVGDDADNRQYRGFLSFNTAGLPDRAIVLSVTLRVKAARVVGASTLNKQRSLWVDVCAPYFGASAALTASDYQAGEDCLTAGSLAGQAGNAWFVAQFPKQALSVINLTGITQVRLRSDRDYRDNLKPNYIVFYGGESPPADAPVLVVKYRLP
jgi:exo-beta-1,3-glucanase (GH17 family)